MPISADDMKLARVGVLGVSVDESTTWTSTGPAGNRNTLNTAERIVNRAINALDGAIAGISNSSQGFNDRFTAVVGNEGGADQAEFDAIGKNLIQAVHDLIQGGPGGASSFIDTFTGTDWAITHNLGRQYVSVQVIDDNGNQLVPDIDFESPTDCTLHFTKSVSGTAVVRR